jgi:TRAP-type C4-dicarboxylate transport system permease small subunit
MKMKFSQKAGLLLFMLSATIVNAQNLGLADGGNKILSELVKAFPIVAGIAFIWVGWKALNEYNETKDVLSALKIVGWYLLAVFFIVGAYQVVKTTSF